MTLVAGIVGSVSWALLSIAAVVNWTIPVDASRGDHSVVFVGENVYCEPAAPVRVSGADDASTPVLAEGTVGAAAGRAPAAPASTSGRSEGGRTPAAIAAAVAAVAVAGGGGALAWRRRRLRIPG